MASTVILIATVISIAVNIVLLLRIAQVGTERHKYSKVLTQTAEASAYLAAIVDYNQELKGKLSAEYEKQVTRRMYDRYKELYGHVDKLIDETLREKKVGR